MGARSGEREGHWLAVCQGQRWTERGLLPGGCTCAQRHIGGGADPQVTSDTEIWAELAAALVTKQSSSPREQRHQKCREMPESMPVVWATKAEGNVDKKKCPYDLQPIDKYWRQAEGNLPPGSSQLS